MPVDVEIRVSPEQIEDGSFLRRQIARALSISPADISHTVLTRRSIDARKQKALFVLRFKVYFGEEIVDDSPTEFRFKDVSRSEPAIIVGFGPAGMFAALKLIELGIKPIVLERGKAVHNRRRDIARIQKHGEVNPESNYCFGEGGAGTFSDGKLYTRSNKRGSTERILQLLVHHGAHPDILIDAHPHVGTNKLPQVVTNIRETVLQSGGEVHFESRVESIITEGGMFRGVKLASGEKVTARGLVLAVGHSARDVFTTLADCGINLERKPFALGLRVEHPQQLIDEVQYKSTKRSPHLPAAAYSFVTQCHGRGVFSFCMCPGGIICPAATDNNQVVVNGWSPSKRNSRFANSGIVVEVQDADLADGSVLAGVDFQRALEERAFCLGGGAQVAPAQRLGDFVDGKISNDLPDCSYLPGVRSSPLTELFPPAFSSRLQEAFRHFAKKSKGYLTNEALVVAVESRTSSPVRIPRDPNSLMHPQMLGFFPAGEGAGYAGGIMSAAMDGERCAASLAEFYSK